MTPPEGDFACVEMSQSPSGIFLVVAGPGCALARAVETLLLAPFPGESVVVVLDDGRAELSALMEARPELIRVCRWVLIGGPFQGINADFWPNISAATAALEARLLPGDKVLLAGAAEPDLVRYAPRLREALAPAQATVDLDALRQNARALSALGSALLPVVKANAYGLGAPVVAWALSACAAGFVVAYPDEGVELRRAGLEQPILVQNVLEPEVAKLVQHKLEAQVSSIEQLAWLEREARALGASVGVHLKVDTGMGRAGQRPPEARELLAEVARRPSLRLEGLMTHFASADEPWEDDFTRQQIARFQQVVAEVRTPLRWVHAANSAGAARFPEARGNAVRSGIALWGYARNLPLEVRPVLRLTTRVVSVKTLPPGESVGYGRSWTTGDTERRIAVVAIGYYDGYPRAFSNKGWMTLHGERCAVVGRVCMDVTMLDVTHLGPRVRPGDEVVIYGNTASEPDLEALAALIDTIPYELLTRLSPRIRRIYRQSCDN